MGVARVLRTPPSGPWTAKMVMRDVLMASWPVPPSLLAPHVPLPLDTYGGNGWITLAIFDLTDARLRRLPCLPGMDVVAELQVRTYVRVDGKPGVWYLSVDATHPLTVLNGRWYHRPYHHARTTLGQRGDTIFFHCTRRHCLPRTQFAAHYSAAGAIFAAEPGSLVEFLVERYFVYSMSRRRELFVAEQHHRPWPLRAATARLAMTNLMPDGVTLPATQPLLVYCERLDVCTWPARHMAAAQPRPAQRSAPALRLNSERDRPEPRG